MTVWNAIYVSSRQEKKIQERLSSQGIEAYVPLKKTLSQWSDRKKWVATPLISGYVFVRSGEAVKQSILQTQGVVAFVRYNGSEAVIRQSEIDTLRSIELHGYEISLATGPLEPGDKITIFQGPLKGMLAQVLEVNNDSTVCAFILEGTGHSFKIILPKAILKKEADLC